ncbi:hypothetical protein [Haloferula sp.]|uniref:hypothetical protein n=1 Tax=Haloferula sp. TaxID=2497595 RepID=UPI00329E906E
MFVRSAGFHFLLLLVSLITRVHGDAFVITKAASSPNIVEVFVEDEAVRVTMEIGESSIADFRPLLVEAAKRDLLLKGGQEAAAESAHSPFRIQADSRDLQPEIVSMKSGRRLVRDEITGEALPQQPDDVEAVVHVELRYGFENKRPLRLEIQRAESEAMPTIGFVAYHHGLPVNDFRYFPARVTLDLNWEDEWYSSFRLKNLQRQNYEPLSAFLYVEPYEVRKEIIVRPRDIQRFVDLGLAGKETIPVAMQEDLQAKVVEFFKDKGKVLIDGKEVTGELDRIHFVRRSLRTTGIVDPPEELPVGAALLGIIFSYPVDHLPDQVELHWDVFDDLIKKVPSAATDEAGPLPTILEPDNSVLVWENFLKNPVGSQLREITLPEREKTMIPVVSLACLLLAIGFGLWIRRGSKANSSAPKGAVAGLVVTALVGIVCLPIGRMEVPRLFGDNEQIVESEEVALVSDLLFNVYRAFDRRDQTQVFDRLAESIDGDLLEEVYLDTRRSIEIENQGGLRVKIDEVEVLDLERLSDDAASYRCRWLARGSVGHWGHVHRRENERSAEMTLAAVDGKWKVIKMHLLDES